MQVALRRGRHRGTLEGFAFLMPPTGQRIELIDAAMRPAFQRWFSGGVFA